MSQAEFANEIGMSPRTYQDIERGITVRLEADVLERLVAMGVDLEALVSSEMRDIRAGYRLDLLGEIAALRGTSPMQVWIDLGLPEKHLRDGVAGGPAFTKREMQMIQDLWRECFPGGISEMERKLGYVELVNAGNVDKIFQPKVEKDLIAEPTPAQPPGVDHVLTAAKIRAAEAARQGGDPATVVPPALSGGELLIMEFGAWVRRKLLKSPEALDDLEPALRRLINEVEHGPLNALKMDVVAHPDAWGDNLRALVMALPALERRRLMDWLAEQISAQADRDLGPARETAAGGDRK